MRLRHLAAAALAATTVAALALPATAQEAPGSADVERRLDTAEERLAELEADASTAVEAVNEAQVELDQAEAGLAGTLERAEEVAAEAAVLREGTDAVARTLYKGGGTNLQFGALLAAEGPTEAGVRYATVQRVLATHRGEVQALQAARTELASLEERAEEQRDEAAARTETLAERRDELEVTLAGQADEIAALEDELAEAREREEAARRAEEERRRREAEERAAAERRTAEREAVEERAVEEREPEAPTTEAPATEAPATEAPATEATEAPEPTRPTRSSSGDGGGGGDAAPSPPSTRSSAQVAVDTALAQVGKPYVWGGGGPDSFDCSGLTSYAWRAAGVSLPHSSRMQLAATQRISRGQLQPGDLVFFGSPIHHVALYVGGGRVVEASRSGVPVRTNDSALSRSDIAGYGRP